MEFFQIIEPKAICVDYASILQHGMIDRMAGEIEVTRAGPFAPPISFPFEAIIVTASFKIILEQSGLSGISFRPAIKKHIVNIDWQTWKRKPKFYPKNGEPEDYLKRKHNPQAAAKMEDLFELVLKQGAELKKESADLNYDLPFEDAYRIKLPTYTGFDIFRPSTKRFWPIWLCNSKAKKWFELNAPTWADFSPMKLIGTMPKQVSLATTKPTIKTMPAPYLNMSCGDEFVGAHAFSADNQHIGIEWHKGCLEVWNMASKKIIKKFAFAPLPKQKRAPDLSALFHRALSLKSPEVWGLGTAKGVRYLLNGSLASGKSTAPILLGKGISISEYDNKKQLCDQGAFSYSANSFLWFSGHDLSFFNLTKRPPTRKALFLTEQVKQMAISRNARYCAVITIKRHLFLIDVAGNTSVAQCPLKGTYQRILFVGDHLLICASAMQIIGISTKDGKICWKVQHKPLLKMNGLVSLKEGEWLLACTETKNSRDLFWLIRPRTRQIVEFGMNPEDPTVSNMIYSLLTSSDGEWIAAHLPKNFVVWRSADWIKSAEMGA